MVANKKCYQKLKQKGGNNVLLLQQQLQHNISDYHKIAEDITTFKSYLMNIHNFITLMTQNENPFSLLEKITNSLEHMYTVQQNNLTLFTSIIPEIERILEENNHLKSIIQNNCITTNNIRRNTNASKSVSEILLNYYTMKLGEYYKNRSNMLYDFFNISS
jgi:ABC-type uncharacterized transport system substrate-binding protein